MQILLGILTVLTVYARQAGLPVFFFWPSLWVLLAVTILNVTTLPPPSKPIALVILAVFLALIRIAAVPHLYQLGGDAVFEAQVGSNIVQTGYWNPKQGAGYAENYYGYNPVLHFMTAAISVTTGVDSYSIVKYILPPVYKALIMILVLLVIKNIVQQRESQIVYTATMLFIGSAGFAYIGITRRSTASLFVLLSILSMMKEDDSGKELLWNSLFIVFSVLIVLSNRSISVYFLIFLLGAFIFKILARFIPGYGTSKTLPNIESKLLFFVLVLAAWQIHYSHIFLVEDLRYAQQIKNLVFGPEGLRSLFGMSGDQPGISIYRRYETLLLYGSQICFLLLGGSGFLIYIVSIFKTRNSTAEWINHESFLLYLSIFGFALYLFSALLMRTPLDIAVSISLWFFVIPITIFGGYLLKTHVTLGKFTSITHMVVILFLVSTSLLMGNYTPRLTNRAPNEDIVAEHDARSQTSAIFHAGQWLLNNTHKDSDRIRVLGDWDIYSVFSGFFSMDVNPYPLWLTALYKGDREAKIEMIQKNNFEFGSYFHTHHYEKLDYFVVNSALTTYPSLTFGEPMHVNSLGDLDNIYLLDKVYSNEEILLYKINRGVSLD